MHVSRIMKGLVHTVRAEDTLAKASRCMRQEKVSFLPVVEEAGLVETQPNREVLEAIGFQPVVEETAVVGMLTDRDIVNAVVLSEKDPKVTPVSDAMTRHLAYCYVDCEISEAAASMERKHARYMFVLNRQGHTVGIVSLDYLTAIMTHLAEEVPQGKAA